MAARVVATTPWRVPADALVEMVVRTGFGAADDWIAEQAGPGDIVITADVPLAARSLAKAARVLDAKGYAFTDSDIGAALAMRDPIDELRQTGTATRGPAPTTATDRSPVPSKLDDTATAVHPLTSFWRCPS